MVSEVPEADDATLHLPRILCLHGGGTNAKIFRAQCRVLERALRPTFRLCFAEAPFPSQPGSDVSSVYKDFGPFRAWLRWLPGDPERESRSVVEQIEESLRKAMGEDDRKGATGEWVALLGFSQGAKLCASLLFSHQVRAEKFGRHTFEPDFRFAVLLAGRGPLVSLAPELSMTPGLVDASCISVLSWLDEQNFAAMEHRLRLPTIHVHGMKDPGLDLHRKLLYQCCGEGSTKLIEWDGDHRVPIKTKDVTVIVEEILSTAKEAGVLRA
jgi:Serine hydrolase (FSH1)